MPLSDFRDTFAWREAIELSPELVQLAEQLPASEERGLAYRLREAMVELPAAIAFDLLEGDSYTRKHSIGRLAAMLDIIDKVYPALDTGDARKMLDKLALRVGSSETFAEQTPGAAKVYLPGAKVHAGPASLAPVPKPALGPVPDLSAVKVTPDDIAVGVNPQVPGTQTEEDEAPVLPPTKIQVMPDGPGDSTGDHVG